MGMANPIPSERDRGHAIERAGLYGKLSQLNPVGQAAPKPADFLGFVPSQTVYPPIGTTPILPLNVAILAPDTAFPSFRNRYPANVPTLSAYRIILPVLWRDPYLFGAVCPDRDLGDRLFA